MEVICGLKEIVGLNPGSLSTWPGAVQLHHLLLRVGEALQLGLVHSRVCSKPDCDGELMLTSARCMFTHIGHILSCLGRCYSSWERRHWFMGLTAGQTLDSALPGLGEPTPAWAAAEHGQHSCCLDGIKAAQMLHIHHIVNTDETLENSFDSKIYFKMLRTQILTNLFQIILIIWTQNSSCRCSPCTACSVLRQQRSRNFPPGVKAAERQWKQCSLTHTLVRNAGPGLAWATAQDLFLKLQLQVL